MHWEVPVACRAHKSTAQKKLNIAPALHHDDSFTAIGPSNRVTNLPSTHVEGLLFGRPIRSATPAVSGRSVLLIPAEARASPLKSGYAPLPTPPRVDFPPHAPSSQCRRHRGGHLDDTPCRAASGDRPDASYEVPSPEMTRHLPLSASAWGLMCGYKRTIPTCSDHQARRARRAGAEDAGADSVGRRHLPGRRAPRGHAPHRFSPGNDEIPGGVRAPMRLETPSAIVGLKAGCVGLEIGRCRLPAWDSAIPGREQV